MGRLHYELRTDDEKTGDARILICTKRPSLRGASSSPSLSFREQRLRPPGGNVDANDYSSRPRSICPLTFEDENDSFGREGGGCTRRALASDQPFMQLCHLFGAFGVFACDLFRG